MEMTTKTTKRALLSSVLALFLCFSMLIGTTFAWFTDEVKSATNIIAAGNLDVELYNTIGVDDDYKVDGTTALFEEVALWEPGVVAYENLTVANAGTLALKYQLVVNITNAKGLKNLADVLKVAVVEGGIEDTVTRNDLMKLDNYKPFTSFMEAGELYPESGKDTKTYGIVIWWEPSDKDNDYNMNNENQGTVLSIDIGVVLKATQLAAESDSFGPDYDENAPYSVWDGKIPAEMPKSLVVDGATQTIHVKDAAAFVYLSTLSAKWAEFYTDGNGTTYTNYANGAGADYYYSGKWTVSLEADIDLNNYAIAPVNIVIGEATGASAFNGNGHTIRNINTTTGLFADKSRASFSDITLENVKATNGSLIGSSDHDISNITVKNATISGTDYVGGVVGYTYGVINGCKVIDSSVVATGKEAGGLAGYVVTSRAEATVAYNTVNNVSVYANNRAAGLVAQVNVNVKVYNNTVDTVTVGAEDTSKYAADAVVSNALDSKNVYDNTVINATIVN
jgi:predicted ribosomally synthesized peptide with SipW-like signal peptide